MSTFLAVEIILVFLKSPYVNINHPKQLHLCIYYKCNILVTPELPFTTCLLFAFFCYFHRSQDTKRIPKQKQNKIHAVA